MKIKSTLLLLACFTMLSSFGQNDLKLTLIKDNDQPISKTEHFYLFQIKNNSNSDQVLNLNAINSSCSQINKSSQVELNHVFLKEDKTNLGKNVTIKSRSSESVLLKIFRPKNTKLNTWNCHKVFVTNINETQKSNSIIIKTLVPDPKDFN